MYSPEEQLIQLETEHEWVTESWIATSQVKYGPIALIVGGIVKGGRLVKHEELFSVTPHSHQILHFPLLSSDDRIVFAKKIEELYDMILDQALIRKCSYGKHVM